MSSSRSCCRLTARTAWVHALRADATTVRTLQQAHKAQGTVLKAVS